MTFINTTDIKKYETISSAKPESFPNYDAIKIQNPSIDTKKPTKPKTKGWIGFMYVESVIVNGKPKFLCKTKNDITIKGNLEFEDKVIRPLNVEECGYYPYSFVSEEDLLSMCIKHIF